MPPLTVKAPAPLLPFLFATLPEVKKTRIRQWLKFSAVRVNGQPVTRFDHPLLPGDQVCIHEEKPPPAAALLPADMRIVFEDAALLVVEKPEGLLTIATDTERTATAFAHVTNYVRGLSPRSRARVWIVHRLDRETSGLILFARTEEVKQALQENWAAAQKHYHAIVEGGPPQDSGLLTAHLDESQPFKVFSTRPSEKTREARTRYRVLRRAKGRSLLDITLETGRRHQIRVQLASIGCPIVGDEKYGARTDAARRLALHACRLTFHHPVTGQEMTFESPLPESLSRLV